MNEIMRWLAYGLGAILMILGGVEAVRRLAFRFHRPAGAKGRLVLVMVPGGPEDCEVLARAAAQRMRWMDMEPPCRLVCLDQGGEAGEIVRKMEKSCPGLEVLGQEEFFALFVQPDGGRERR